MHIGDFPESLNQAMLVGTMLVGRLRVRAVCAALLSQLGTTIVMAWPGAHTRGKQHRIAWP